MRKPLIRPSLLTVLLLCVQLLSAQTSRLDLSAEWQFAIDRDDSGEAQQWYKSKTLDDTMFLPGSMPEMLKGDDVTIHTQWTGSLYDSSYYYNPAMEKYRVAGNVKLPFFLTPDKHYVGAAWYNREVSIPRDWKGQHVVLTLERPHWETTVWVNGKRVGMQNSLCVAHEYDVTDYVRSGNNLISIRVDNRVKDINPGPDSHSITDQTQGNWNGIVGALTLTATERIYIDDVQVFPDVERNLAVVKTTVVNDMGREVRGTLDYTAICQTESRGTHSVGVTYRHVYSRGVTHIVDTLQMGSSCLKWDEFHPDVYRLRVAVQDSRAVGYVTLSSRSTSFGMREFAIDDMYFTVNGRRILLRGTVENCDFPLTGYAPMDEASWERVFRTCKRYGLNHMRFHSFCPPEAAFAAADKLGFYLQPEGPSWPNHGSSLGNGEPIDDYLWNEAQRMVKAYGNHPSFCMMAIGNEPRGRWVEWVTKFVSYWKDTDPRRVYTGASVGGGWQWQPGNQYHVKAGARGLEWDRQRPNTLDDFRHNRFLSQARAANQPYVSHETGQWCVFPNFSEIRKYTGVNKAKNFEIFRDLLSEHDMGELGHDFMMASGELQALCYKYEIEKTLRTPDYSGFQLLALNDYSGQGTALVGVTDVFFDEKEYISPSEWRRFCCETVPLARLPQFVYQPGDTLTAEIDVAHYGPETLHNVTVLVKMRSELDEEWLIDGFHLDSLPTGGCYKIGTVQVPVEDVMAARRETLVVSIHDTDYENQWPVWFYPSQPSVASGDIFVTDSLTAEARDVLARGGDVLVTAAGKISYGRGISQNFLPVFWNTSWFKMRPPHTTGVLINDAHPLFRSFPTESHSDLQWWELLNRTQTMLFTDFPQGFQPIVQSIDTWFLSRKIGVLFEARVGKGRLLMTTIDIDRDLDSRPVARQLRSAIVEYMQSPYFRPQYDVPVETVADLFTKQTPAVSNFTNSSPDELKPKIN